MARRHFDNKGFPNLKRIIKEICEYVESLEIEYINFSSMGNIIDTNNTAHGHREVSYDVDFAPDLSKKPFKVKGIYVVGGQVAFLPDSYNTGNHDLDLVVKTNVGVVSFSDQAEGGVLCGLGDILNNGKGCWTDRETKEFALDLFDDEPEAPLKPPYLQIYPLIKRTDS